MISFKTVTAICLGAMLCTAQAINISGIVKDTAGVGISGATVKLEVANITTASGSDGSFTLTNGSTQIQQDINNRGITASPIQIQNGKVFTTLSENAPVAISIYDVSGRQIYNIKKTYGSGAHAIEAPLQSKGIFIYKVNIGNEAYSFKSSPSGTFSTEQLVALSATSTLAKSAKATAAIADVISVVKEGQLNYRYSIKTSDTSGVVVKMIPNAGNVTDADGNVYQSVQIGNQVWTVENLRTKKYNDGTVIPLITGTSAWASITTPGRCWFDNDSATNHAPYGVLYNWYTVNTGKLAPTGWHVPTDAEWTTLQNYLISNGYNWDGTTSGNKIAKSMASQTDWASHTVAVVGTIGNDLSKNNASGFSALPSSFRYNDGYFYGQSDIGCWWSATVDVYPGGAMDCHLYSSNEYLVREGSNKRLGLSVRLLRD